MKRKGYCTHYNKDGHTKYGHWKLHPNRKIKEFNQGKDKINVMVPTYLE